MLGNDNYIILTVDCQTVQSHSVENVFLILLIEENEKVEKLFLETEGKLLEITYFSQMQPCFYSFV